jgi:hypothetical protein
MAGFEGSVREVHGDPFPMVDQDAGVDEPVPRKARLHLVRDQRCRKGVLQDPSCAADMFDAQTPPTSPSAAKPPPPTLGTADARTLGGIRDD